MASRDTLEKKEAQGIMGKILSTWEAKWMKKIDRMKTEQLYPFESEMLADPVEVPGGS